MLCADCLIPRKPCWKQMLADVSPFQQVCLYQPGRLLGEHWLLLARGQVTQEWLTDAGEPDGSQTLCSVVAEVLSAAQSWGTAGSQPVPRCCSVAVWWHTAGEGKEAPRTCSMATNPLTAGHTRGSLPALVSAQKGQHLCKSTGFILETIFLILLCLPQQTVPQPSHPSQPVGDSSCQASLCSPMAGPWRWGMLFPAATVTAVRVPIHHPCPCYKRHPAHSFPEVDQMVLGLLPCDRAKYVYNGWYLIQQVIKGTTMYSLKSKTSFLKRFSEFVWSYHGLFQADLFPLRSKSSILTFFLDLILFCHL